MNKNAVSGFAHIALGVVSALGLFALAPGANAQTYAAGTLTLTPTSTPITVGGVTTRITANAEVLVQNSSGGILWRSNNSGPCVGNACNLRFQGDGNLLINYSTGLQGLSYTNGNPSASLTFAATPPYMKISTGGTTLWTTGTATPSSVGYLPGGLSLSGGQSVSIGGVSLQLTTGGDIQVRDVATTALLWNAGTSASCSTPSACTLSFDANGALKLTGPSGLAWTTSTSATALGGTLTLSKYQPYLSILEGKGVLWAAGPGTTDVTYGNGFTLDPGTKVGAGGVSLELTTGGNVIVRNGGSIAWQSNTAISGCSVATSCRLRYQGDGNLVLYSGPSAIKWTSNSGGHDHSTLTLSSTSPHLAIRNSNDIKTWDSVSTNVTPTTPTISTQVNGALNQAASMRAFLDSLGVNTHMTQYETNENLVLQKLQHIGVKTIRDGLPSTTALQSKYQTLATNGIRFNLAGYNTTAASVVATATLVKNMAPGALDSLEGLNEISNFPFNYDGFACRTGWYNNCGGAAASAQLSLFNAVNADAQLSAIPVYDLTNGSFAIQAAALGLRTIANRADFGNVHVYPNGVQPQNEMASTMGKAYGLTASQGVVTEGGYTTASVSQRSQAIMGINMWLDGFRLGYRRTFLYELTDGNGEQFGFYDASHNPKLLATAAHNLTTILADTGAGSTGTLSWSASGFTGNSLLLRKTNGTFYLILWNEPTVANGTNDVAVPTTQVFVTFQNVKSVATFDPFVQATALSSTSYPNTQPSITSSVNIGPNAVILAVTP